MSVIASYRYRDGLRVADVPLDAPVRCADNKSEFVWVGLVEPSEEDLRDLRETFDLHPLAVEDAVNAHQMPKLEIYGDQLFIVARTARMEGDVIDYGETAVFVGAHHVVTVRHGSMRGHADLRRQLEAAPVLLRHGTDFVVHGVLDFIVDGYLPVVEAVEEEVLRMETSVLDASLSREDVSRLFLLRRQLAQFQRYLGPTYDLVSKLANLDLPCIDPESRPYFRDVLDHVRRIDARVQGLREVLGTVFEVSALLEQQRQGDIVRRLASWAAILAVPTAVAGIYGMNFEHMPELSTRNGYFVVIGFIVTVCVWLFVRFKRIGWL